jgi:HK97 family phage portal protein
MPNIFSKLYQTIKDSLISSPTQQTKITGYEQYGYPYLISETKKTEYLNELQGWVASCVTAIADEIASVELKLMSFKNEEVIEIDEHPLIDLLYKVNDYTTRFDHFWITQVYLELTGEAPWFLEKNGNQITGIYFLRPDKLSLVSDRENRLVSSYTYDVGMGKRVPLTLDEVLFLKYPDPANPFRGKGTLAMASRTVDVDNFSEEWNKTFYKNAAKPDSILKVKTDSMTDEQRSMLKRSLKEQYEGIEKAHKTMVLFGDMEWQQIGVSQKDMDFLEQQKFSRDKILGIFRVPKAVVAQTEGVNLASAQVAQYTFAKWCIKPKIERLIQQLNEFLIPQFKNSETLYLEYDNIVPEDVDTAIKKYQSGLSLGWLSINEVREMENLSVIDGGDNIYVNGQVVGTTISKSIKGENKISKSRKNEIHSRNKNYFEIQNKKEKFVKSIEELVLKSVKSKKQIKKIKQKSQDVIIDEIIKLPKFTSVEEKFAFWQMKDAIFNKHFPKFKDSIIQVFQEQYKEVIGKLLKAKGMPEIKSGTNVYNKIKLNEKKEEERVLKITMPLLEDLFSEAGTKTYEALGIDVNMSPKREEIQTLINDYGREFAKSMNTTTNEAIKKSVYNNFSNGGSLMDLKSELVKYFDSSEQYRADRIARTESTRYSTAATEQAFVDSGVVKAKQWFVNPDACGICEPLKGKIVNLGVDYFKLGETIKTPDGKEFKVDYTDIKSPPLHVSCRCDLIPIWYDSAINSEFKRLDISEKSDLFDRKNDVYNNVQNHIDTKGKIELSESDKESFLMYTGPQYKIVNNFLRFGEYNSIDQKIEIETGVQKISKIISNNKIDEDYIVFRGISLKMSEDKFKNKFKIGSEIIDNGFVSSTFDQGQAEKFIQAISKSDQKILFNIKIPKNSNALIINRTSAGIKTELEVLIDKGSKYTIENILKTTGLDGQQLTRVDVIYNGQVSKTKTFENKSKVKSDTSRFVWSIEDIEIISSKQAKKELTIEKILKSTIDKIVENEELSKVDILKLEYSEKLKELDIKLNEIQSKLTNVSTIENEKQEDMEQIKNEKRQLRQIRKQLVNQYNLEMDAE